MKKRFVILLTVCVMLILSVSTALADSNANGTYRSRLFPSNPWYGNPRAYEVGSSDYNIYSLYAEVNFERGTSSGMKKNTANFTTEVNSGTLQSDSFSSSGTKFWGGVEFRDSTYGNWTGIDVYYY